MIEGVSQTEDIPVYRCSEEDYSKFYPVDNKGAEQLKRIQEDEDRQLYCIDWRRIGPDLFGSEANGHYGHIDIAVVPC